MNRKNPKLINVFKITMIVMLMGFYSCQHQIDLELPEDKKLVLLTNFTPEEYITVRLGTTSKLNQNTTHLPDENAVLELYQNGEKIDQLEYRRDSQSETPFYISKFKPAIGEEYSIIGKYLDYPEIRSVDIIPPEITVRNTTLLSKDIYENYTGNYTYDLSVEIELSEEDKKMEFFHIRFVDELDFYYLLNSDTIKHFVFPQEVFFKLADQSVDHISLYHEPGILINRASLPDPSKIELDFNVINLPGLAIKGSFPIQIRSGSTHYYKFHKSVGEQEVTSADNNNIFSIPSTLIYNNIENGIGNFSGYSCNTVDIKLK